MEIRIDTLVHINRYFLSTLTSFEINNDTKTFDF